MLSFDEKDEDPTNIPSILNPLEGLLSDEIDNLNTSIKQDETLQKQLKIKTIQGRKKSVEDKSDQNGQTNQKQTSTESFDNINVLKIRIQEVGADVPTQEEQIQIDSEKESSQSKFNQSDTKQSNDFCEFKNGQEVPETISLSPTKIQLQKNIERRNSIGYEQFRKGFEALNQGSIELAKLHNKAKRIKKIDFQSIENDACCECCGLPIEGQDYSINCSVDEFGNFGVGFSLYFIYLKFTIILLSIAFIPFGLTQ